MSVTRGQCDARPTVTFPAARHHRPLAGIKLYCLVTRDVRNRFLKFRFGFGSVLEKTQIRFGTNLVRFGLQKLGSVRIVIYN